MGRNPLGGSNDVQAASARVELLWRLGPVVFVQIALSLTLLNAKALAFEQLSLAFQQSSQGNQDSQAESHSESALKLDEKFKAVVDMTKLSKKVSFGPLSVTTSYMNSNTLIGIAPAIQTRQDQTLTFDVANFGKDNGIALPLLFSILSPSAVYVNSFVKEASNQKLPDGLQMLMDGLPDRNTGISSGASWTWNGGNVGLSYWNYNLDAHYPGGAYYSAGHGFDATLGSYADKFGFYAKLSYHQAGDLSYQAQDFAPFSRAVDRGYDTYVSMSYKPQHLPDIVVDGGIGRYDYNSFGAVSDGMYWTATVGFDFSKFIWTPVETKPGVPTENIFGLPSANPVEARSLASGGGIFGGLPNARLFYRYSNQIDRSYGFVTTGGSQLWGMIFRVGLN
jgi:hypothetical protein